MRRLDDWKGRKMNRRARDDEGLNELEREKQERRTNIGCMSSKRGRKKRKVRGRQKG